MAFPQGLSFRQTDAFVTDVSPATSEIGQAVNYPRTTPQGNTVGWETVVSTIQVRNRQAGNDARLAGLAFPNTSTDVVKYRIDLPAAGSYNMRWASGDGSYTTSAVVSLYDTTTLLTALSTGTTSAAQTFKDATDVEWTNVTWPGSNVAITKTFASTICRLQTLGAVSGAYTHFYIEAAAATGPTITTQPAAQRVGVGSTATFTIAATGTGTLHYDWEVDRGGGWGFGNAVGATDAATYTTPATTLAFSGYVYRCNVTDDNGTTVSSSAILTVVVAGYEAFQGNAFQPNAFQVGLAIPGLEAFQGDAFQGDAFQIGWPYIVTRIPRSGTISDPFII
jgi:hypothetical protein